VESQVTGFTGPESLGAALYGCQLVVIPAGVPRKPGMTRDDLFNINASEAPFSDSRPPLLGSCPIWDMLGHGTRQRTGIPLHLVARYRGCGCDRPLPDQDNGEFCARPSQRAGSYWF
jgi:hypothetical protein